MDNPYCPLEMIIFSLQKFGHVSKARKIYDQIFSFLYLIIIMYSFKPLEPVLKSFRDHLGINRPKGQDKEFHATNSLQKTQSLD